MHVYAVDNICSSTVIGVTVFHNFSLLSITEVGGSLWCGSEFSLHKKPDEGLQSEGGPDEGLQSGERPDEGLQSGGRPDEGLKNGCRPDEGFQSGGYA